MQVSWVRLLMYCSNRLLAVSVNQPIPIAIYQKVSMEIRGNDFNTGWEIFNYYQYLVIVGSAQFMSEYVNPLHLWKSRKILGTQYCKKLGRMKNFSLASFLKSYLEKQVCALVVLSIQVYQPDILQACGIKGYRRLMSEWSIILRWH